MYIKFSLLNPREIFRYVGMIRGMGTIKKHYNLTKYKRQRTNLIFKVIGLIIIQFSTFILPIILIGYLTYNGTNNKNIVFTDDVYISNVKDRKFSKNYKSFKGESLEGSGKFFYLVNNTKVKECIERPNTFVEIKFFKKLWTKGLPIFSKIVIGCKQL